MQAGLLGSVSMPSALLFALCFISGQWPGALPPSVFQPRPGVERVIDLVPPPNPVQAGRSDPAIEQKRFVDSFNRLNEALADFANEYNQNHAVDVKKIRAMKKAWRELKKNEPWFKVR
jgi:hypothetical protein